jgi:hypothetical protein
VRTALTMGPARLASWLVCIRSSGWGKRLYAGK